jgi:hypothetical protein
MPKVHRVDNLYGEGKGGWVFHCPACTWSHGPADTWQFNGDIEKPTFKPSILVRHPNRVEICHSFVTDGKIQYLNDCTHELAGKTVDLPEWE